MSDASSDKRWVFMIGGSSAAAGAILGLVGNLIHPATSGPGHPAETARVIAESDIWIPLHITLLVSFIFILGGLVAIHDSITGGLPAALARFGLSAAVVGTASGVVLLSLDGFAAKHLAESWLSAPPELRPTALASFRAEDSINFALLSPLNLVFAGFTFVLSGWLLPSATTTRPGLGGRPWSAVSAEPCRESSKRPSGSLPRSPPSWESPRLPSSPCGY